MTLKLVFWKKMGNLWDRPEDALSSACLRYLTTTPNNSGKGGLLQDIPGCPEVTYQVQDPQRAEWMTAVYPRMMGDHTELEVLGVWQVFSNEKLERLIQNTPWLLLL